jgi:NitT/TauT family transport system ATP-binding protein
MFVCIRLALTSCATCACEKAVIHVAGVTHDYPGSPRTRAIDDLSFDVRRGEIVAVVGQSGCGKTTLLKIIGGLLTPTGGEVTIGGFSAQQARAQLRVGIVFQNPVLLPWRTVRENVLLPFELRTARLTGRRGDSTAVERLARDWVRLVGLDMFWTAYPDELSGGMRARVAIARALSYEPEVLLMDEPFGSLDEITRTRLNEDLATLHRKSAATILLVTHSLREAAFLSNRVIILNAHPGRIQSVVNVPAVHDRRSWRETREFSAFCLELHDLLGDWSESSMAAGSRR